MTPPNPRKLEAKLLAQYLADAGAEATSCETVEEGVLQAIQRAGEDGVVLCFGSLYTIGSIHDAMKKILKA